jgi:hypothetical protein
MKGNAEQVYTVDWLRKVGSTSIVRTWELVCNPAGYTTTTGGDKYRALNFFDNIVCRRVLALA